MKNISIKLIALALLLSSYQAVAPIATPEKGTINGRWMQYFSNHAEEVSEGLARIGARKKIYKRLAKEYAKIYRAECLEYNGRKLDNWHDILDFLISHEYNESKGILSAVSPANAIGLRQWLKSTAKEHGLVVNKLIDERLDPEKSARATLEYILRYAKAYNHSVDLALAAYNGHPKRVEDALKENPLAKDDLEIKKFLAPETVAYCAKIDCLYMMLKHPVNYGLKITL